MEPDGEEAETTAAADVDDACNLKVKAEKQKQEGRLHSSEEADILLLRKMADNAVNETEMNWKNVRFEVKEHERSAVVAAEDRRLHLKKVEVVVVVVGNEKMVEIDDD